MKDIQCGLYPDKARVGIMIGETEPEPTELARCDIDTAQLETFIRNMAATRAEMTPEVPKRLDPGRPIFKDSTFSPPLMVGQYQMVTGKGIYLALRHAGYGWLAFSLTPEKGAELVQLLAEAVIRAQPKRKIILP